MSTIYTLLYLIFGFLNIVLQMSRGEFDFVLYARSWVDRTAAVMVPFLLWPFYIVGWLIECVCRYLVAAASPAAEWLANIQVWKVKVVEANDDEAEASGPRAFIRLDD